MARNLKTSLLKIKNTVEGLDRESSQSFFSKLVKESVSYDKYKNTEFTKEEIARIELQMKLQRFGHGSFTPIICKGSECPFRDVCQLAQMGKTPNGEPCPLEVNAIFSSYQKWCDVMTSKEMDPSDPFLSHSISTLTYLDLLLQRAKWSQASGYQSPVIEVVVKVGRLGEMEKQIMENPSYAIMERLQKMQMNILESLAITPKEEYKKKVALKQKDESDMAMLMFKRRQMLKESLNTTDAVVDLPEHFDVDVVK